MAAVSIVHQQMNTIFSADCGQRRNITENPPVIRASNIYRTNISIIFQHCVNLLWRNPPLFRPDPYRVQIQQRRGVYRAAVGIAGHEHPASRPGPQQQHRLDAQGTAAGTVQCPGRPKGGGRPTLALLDGIPAVVEAAGIGQLSQIQLQGKQGGQQTVLPLVPRRVERHPALLPMAQQRLQ